MKIVRPEKASQIFTPKQSQITLIMIRFEKARQIFDSLPSSQYNKAQTKKY